MTRNGDFTPELDNHIGKAANAFNKLLSVMRHKSIKLPTKMAFHNTVVLLTLLYGTESWNTNVQEETQLAAFHTRCLRKVLGVTWLDHMPKEEIFERTDKTPLINTLRQKRFIWLGHMQQACLHHRLVHWKQRG